MLAAGAVLSLLYAAYALGQGEPWVRSFVVALGLGLAALVQRVFESPP